MKKRIIAWILALLILTGCTPSVPGNTTDSTAPTEEPGLYQPESQLEQQTAGAVKAYPLPQGSWTDFAVMEDSILLFSQSDSATTLTKLTGENCIQEPAVEIPLLLEPDDTCVYVAERGMAYYNAADHTLVILDSNLAQEEVIALPEDLSGAPVLGENFRSVYYCTGSLIREFQLQTGISRLIRDFGDSQILLQDVLLNNTVLRCQITESNGKTYTEFISAETGEMLGVDSDLEWLYAVEDTYFLRRQTELVLGVQGEKAQSLRLDPEMPLEAVLPLGAVAPEQTEEGWSLCYYDFTKGTLAARTEFSGPENVRCFRADNGAVWFLADSTLCRWDVTADDSPETVCVGPYYTAADPDAEGLTRCRKQADELETIYGVQIEIGSESQKIGSYTVSWEYQAERIADALSRLEQVMACYPNQFFLKTAGVSDSGTIHISLVRAIDAEAPVSQGGTQFWQDGCAYMILPINEALEWNFHRNGFRVMESFLYANTSKLDEWTQMNPKGFAYDGNYDSYATREDRNWLEGDRRAFADSLSMAFATEDRAGIFALAMTQGQEEAFGSAVMQKKLQQLCKAIRDAFDWKKDERTFPWEQYLN